MGTQENLNKFKIGECHNVGNCTHIGEKQAIPSDVANSGGFKCKYCGAQLHEVQKPKSFFEKYGKMIGIIAAAVILLGGGGFGIYKLVSGDDKESLPQNNPQLTQRPKGTAMVYVKQITADNKAFSLKEGASRQLTLTVTPAQNDEQIIVQNSDEKVASVTEKAPCTYEIKALKAGSAAITFMADQSGAQAIVDVAVTIGNTSGIEPGYGTVDLGYATYTGDLKNGKPHGHGTITYHRPHAITGSIEASAGDKYEGEFRNGRVSGGLGYWTHDGNIQTVNP